MGIALSHNPFYHFVGTALHLVWNTQYKGVYVLYSDNPAPFNNSPAHNSYAYAVLDKITLCQLVVDGVD